MELNLSINTNSEFYNIESNIGFQVISFSPSRPATRAIQVAWWLTLIPGSTDFIWYLIPYPVP